MRSWILTLCLCCALDDAAHTAAVAPTAPLRTRAELQALLDGHRPSALDAFTPYGKRRFLRSIAWGANGIGGFGVTQPVRELDAVQLAALLDLVDAKAYLPSMRAELLGAPLRLPEPSADVERDLQALEDLAHAEHIRDGTATVAGDPELVNAYRTRFAARMAAAALQRAPSADLPLLFDAAMLVDSRNPASPAFDHMLLVYGELNGRGIATRRTFDGAVLRSLAAARRFDDAKAFRVARPALADTSFPDVIDHLDPAYTGRSVYRYDAATNSLTRAAVPSPAGTQLVIVVASNCHFSLDALAAIHADPDLQARLRQANVMLVTPPDAPIPYRFIADWNAANPALPMSAPHDMRGWEAMRMASVPHFYLLKDGKVVGEDLGWPAGGNKQALLDLLDRASP